MVGRKVYYQKKAGGECLRCGPVPEPLLLCLQFVGVVHI
uniref:Uncharacterized protein n=1 Tax=Anguilla anguilla TaxID=7936 RepID=A0A0E9UUN5_ANGAN